MNSNIEVWMEISFKNRVQKIHKKILNDSSTVHETTSKENGL